MNERNQGTIAINEASVPGDVQRLENAVRTMLELAPRVMRRLDKAAALVRENDDWELALELDELAQVIDETFLGPDSRVSLLLQVTSTVDAAKRVPKRKRSSVVK